MENMKQMPQFPEPYWRDSIEIPSYSKLDQNIKVDVAVVGGGITGITAAYLLSKQNLNVALLEADVILNGTTGHTTAKITAQHGLIYDEFIQHFGEDTAKLYYEAQMEAKQMIEDTINELQIDCDFKKEDAYIYTNSDEYVKKLETEKQAYDTLQIPSELLNEISLDIPMKSALKMNDQAQFHPLKYLKVLADESVKNGVQIYEQTTAVDIEFNKRPTILTRDEHRVTCNHVIVASHYPFYDGVGFYPTRMYPERSYIIGIKTDKPYPGGMYINAESPSRSLRNATINGEDLWLIVGENHKTGQGESTIKHYEALQQFAEQHFGISEYVYRWSAQDLTTLDKMPYIGPITKDHRNIFVATGYRKWGMTNGTIAAKIICDQITGQDNRYSTMYSPSRFQADPMVRKFVKFNADVAKHLIKGKLEYTNANIDELSPDEATVIRVNGKRTGVYRDQNNQLYAVDTTCKHLGCEVEWNSGDRTWDCPCHGSRYAYTGDVIEGPAKEPLNKVDINK